MTNKSDSFHGDLIKALLLMLALGILIGSCLARTP
jgi:hypothetical protein